MPFHDQIGFPVKPVNPLVLGLDPIPTQQRMNSAIARTATLLRKLHQLDLELAILLGTACLMAQGAPRKPHKLAGAALEALRATYWLAGLTKINLVRKSAGSSMPGAPYRSEA